MNNKLYRIMVLIGFLGMISLNAQSQIENLNPIEKMLVKKWQVYKTFYESEMQYIPLESAYVFTFSADYKWKKELANPKLVYHGTWSVDTAKQIVFITWDEVFDTNTYQYKIKTLTEKELTIEPLNASTETVYYKAKE